MDCASIGCGSGRQHSLPPHQQSGGRTTVELDVASGHVLRVGCRQSGQKPCEARGFVRRSRNVTPRRSTSRGSTISSSGTGPSRRRSKRSSRSRGSGRRAYRCPLPLSTPIQRTDVQRPGGRATATRRTRTAAPARSAATAGYPASRAGANMFSPRSNTAGSGPSGFGSARHVPLAFPRCTLRRCNLNRGAPPRLQRCRSFSSASSHRTRAWRQRDRDR
jgi:hypothetical protein